MQSEERRALMGIVAAVVVGVGVAAAGSQGSEVVLGLPFFGLVVGLVYVVQWVAFIPAFITQSERFFDITGSITYVSVTTIAVLLSPVKDGRSVLLMAAVLVWAVRLGTFLFTRVQKEGKDGRFDELKPSFLRFLLVWTLQGLWVTFTASAALVGITTQVRRPLGIAALVGFVAWLIGMAVEVAADTQKSRFRADPANRGRFISDGRLGMVTTSQLLRGDRAMAGRGHHCGSGPSRVAMGRDGIAGIRHSAPDPNQWRADAGAASR